MLFCNLGSVGNRRLPTARNGHRLAALLLGVAFASPALAQLPVITNPPAPQTIFLGDQATFRVGVSGPAPLVYQWFRNGAALGGATSSNLVFTTTATDHGTQFSVLASNLHGTATSAPVALTIDFGVVGPTQTNRLIEITNVWRYHVGKTNLGTVWTAPGYADGAWAAGG
jgi:hypothetical protein